VHLFLLEYSHMSHGLDNIEMVRVRQRFLAEHIKDIDAATRETLAASGVTIRQGMDIAIAVGSRGIAGLGRIVSVTVEWVRRQGGNPFIVPAMGSHGGATAEGQEAVLRGYGIEEATVGAPIRSSMDVIELPRGESPVDVFFDQNANRADATIVINRIKPHTSFRGHYESGLMKMIAIGLGKHRQAKAIHALGVEGLRTVMPKVARQILRQANVVLGIAVVENAYDEPLLIRAIPSFSIPQEEPALLELARRNMPSLPLDRIDLLIVDEIGKNISGLGMDTNIIGRLKIRGQSEPDFPDIRVIVARDLTVETGGNAAGVGLADIATRRLVSKIDFQATYENVLTTGFLERGKLPIIAETDREALDIAFRADGMPHPSLARIVRIQNTLRLSELHVSRTALEDLAECEHVDTLGHVSPVFLHDGTLCPFAGSQ
jgi:hypothetical protein